VDFEFSVSGMRDWSFKIFLGLALVTALPSEAQVQANKGRAWSFEIQSGSAYNFPSPLSFEQGAYSKKITARYSTRPFGGGAAPYYDLRLKRYLAGEQKLFLAFELFHHKLWLDNKPAEVDEFRMTFGYNPLLFSLGKEWNDWARVYAGVGPVIAHPMNTVNGLKLPNSPKLWPTGQRYDFVGFAAQIGGEAFWNFSDLFFASADLKMLFSYAWRIPLVDGRAKTRPLSLHGNLGLGVRW
jgi:hypothetical protein